MNPRKSSSSSSPQRSSSIPPSPSAVVDIALARIAHRLSRTTALGGGGTELERCGEELLEDFRGFMAEAREALAQ